MKKIPILAALIFLNLTLLVGCAVSEQPAEKPVSTVCPPALDNTILPKQEDSEQASPDEGLAGASGIVENSDEPEPAKIEEPKEKNTEEIVYEGAFPDADLRIITEDGKECKLYIGMTREEADKRLAEAGISFDKIQNDVKDGFLFETGEIANYCQYFGGNGMGYNLHFVFFKDKCGEPKWVLMAYNCDVSLTSLSLGLRVEDDERCIEAIYGSCSMVEEPDEQPPSRRYYYKFDQYFLFVGVLLETEKVAWIDVSAINLDLPLESFSQMGKSANT